MAKFSKPIVKVERCKAVISNHTFEVIADFIQHLEVAADMITEEQMRLMMTQDMNDEHTAQILLMPVAGLRSLIRRGSEFLTDAVIIKKPKKPKKRKKRKA